MAFQFLCPQGHLLQGEEEHMGMQCECPQCGVAFIIPTVERSASGVALEAAAPQAPQIDLPPLGADEELASVESVGGLDQLNVSQLDDSDLNDDTLYHIPCPNGHELEVPEDMLGQRVMCPHCRMEFRLHHENSVEYQRQQDMLDRKRAEFWIRAAIVAAAVVGVVLVVMILATMFS